MQLYIGTYISDSKNAIYQLDIEDNTYQVISYKLIHSGEKPSFLVFNKNGDRIYCVNEMHKETDGEFGYVCSLVKDGNEYKMGARMSTNGNHPCHVCLSKDEKLLFVTNYTSGTLCVYGIDSRGNIEKLIDTVEFHGSSVHCERQEAPHPHETILSPCGNYLCMTDLGCDCIFIFKISANDIHPLALMSTIETPKGSGPRHMCFDEKQSILYVCAELSSSVLSFHYNEGNLKFLQETKLFPNEIHPYPRTSCSEISIFNGYVYVGNRGDNTISVCKQQHDGTLMLIQHVNTNGETPRHFVIVKSVDEGLPLLVVGNQDSNSLMIFEILGDDIVLKKGIEEIRTPVCISAR